MNWRWWLAYSVAFGLLHLLPKWWSQLTVIGGSALCLAFIAYRYVAGRLKHKSMESSE